MPDATSMDYYVKVLILAIIQGAAEMLPVSSSAHVIVAEKLMGLDPSRPRETFLLIMLHTGTMFAVLVYFWPRWKPLLLPPRDATNVWQRHRFVWLTLLATTVTGVLGYGLIRLIELGTHEEVEQLFKQLDVVGVALACAGLLILVAGFHESRAKRVNGPPPWTDEPYEAGSDADGRTKQVYGLPLWSALLIGVVQAVTLPLRGFSRSGATISTGLLCGVSRRLSEDFSFALAVLLTPPAVARMVLRLIHAHATLSVDDVLPGLVGMVFSFAAGYVALQLLSAALERGRWKYFGFYCLAAAALLVGLAAYGL